MKRHVKSMCFIATVAAFALGLASAEAASVKLSSKQVPLYHRLDVDLSLVGKWRDPYDSNQIAVDVEFTSPSGEKILLPAFYVAGSSGKSSEWQARFAPREKGRYSFKVAVTQDGKKVPTKLKGEFQSIPSYDDGFLKVSNKWVMKFDSGRPFRGIGENFGWERRDNDDSKYFKALHEDPRFNYDYMLKKLSANGANFTRTWMIYWNLPVDWKQVSNNSRYSSTKRRFNDSGIKRMDELLDIAEKNDVYLMLTIESHAGLHGEGWDLNSYNVKNGGDAKTRAEFFTSPVVRRKYKDKLRYLVARWGYSPNVAAWELFNEIDNVIYNDKNNPPTDAQVTDWHRDMSGYLASVDPYHHIITTSISHRDVTGLYDLPHIEFNQRHIYKGLEDIRPAIAKYTQATGKPYVIGEAGYDWDWQKNFDDFSDGMISDYKRQLWYGLFSETPILPMSWWWEYFDQKGMTPYFNGVQQINQRMLAASNGDMAAVPVTSNVAALKSMGVQAGKKLFIYAYNPTDGEVKADLTVVASPTNSWTKVTAFEPDAQKFGNTLPAQSDSLRGLVLAPHQDRVFILE